ncbi:MAG TPA: exopolysaccharide biosynthesis polyprenyl glycosylphosphotransferase [Miltoncostaeaceae bacterium]|nr:exopolysaccharide biosynthesis polyprenyl glycosylphosphotransferase [Miltoncostaeaceae bacterium]
MTTEPTTDAHRSARSPLRRDVRFLPLLAGPAGTARVRRAASVAVLLAIDVTALFLAIYAALALKLVLQDQPVDSGAIWAVEQKALPIAAVAMVVIFAKNRLYAAREQRPGAAAVLSSVTVGTLIVLVLVLVAGWRFDTYYIFYSSWFLVSVLVVALRASYESLTTLALDAVRFQRRALLVGPPAATEPVAETLVHTSNRRGVPYRVVGRLPLAPAADEGRAVDPALDAAIDPAAIDEVILTGISGVEDRSVLDLLDTCRRRGVPVRLAPTTVELLSHTIQAVPAPGLPLFAVHPPTLSSVQFLGKRAFDLVVGTLLLVVVAPLLLAAALAIRLEDRGPVLHRGRRVGVDETGFTCLKLRTMHIDAEHRQAELEHLNEADGALFKLRDDPRVTRVGRVLRRFSIDELPQLVNVLRGEMSLVGPRPLPVRDYEMLDEVQKKRYLVLPGMTGLWQVSGRSDLSFDELIRLDFYYIETWSIWLDLVILVRTLPVVVSRRGAF